MKKKPDHPPSSPDPHNKYTAMQLKYYESDAKNEIMLKGNHADHNNNRDYWDVLVKDTESGFKDKVGLDYGCGTGRNVMNLIDRFKRFDGVDISEGLAEQAHERMLEAGYDEDQFIFYANNGIDLNGVPDDEYDFVMSTICLQHICVYEVRYSILKELFRVMKPGGLLSIQMRFGKHRHGRSAYYDNNYNAKATNGRADVIVTDESQLSCDLEWIGFEDVTIDVRNGWRDNICDWVYAKARKPVE